MPARVSTGDRDAVLGQMRWCAAVQTWLEVCDSVVELLTDRAVHHSVSSTRIEIALF